MTLEQETNRLAARTSAGGVEVQEALFENILEPAIPRTGMPWQADERTFPVAHDKRKYYSIIGLRLVVDSLMYVCATRVAYWMRFESTLITRHFPPENSVAYNNILLGMLIALPFLMIFLRMSGLYEARARMRTLDRLPKIVGAVNGFIITLLLAMFLLNSSSGYRGYIIFFWFACILFLFMGRVLLQTGYSVMGRADIVERNTLIIGAGQVGKALALKLAQHSEFGLRPVGFVDDHPLIERFSEPEIQDLRILGGLNDITSIIEDNNVEKVIVGFSKDSHEAMLELISFCNNAGIECSVLPRLFEVITEEVLVREIGGISMVPVNKKGLTGVKRLVKAAEDYCILICGLLVTWPILLAIAIAIKLDSKGPVFYKQTRIGRDGKPFQFYKFRSMVQDADAMQADLVKETQGEGDWRCWKLQDDPRVTRVGKFIRKFSLDELPQIFNVLLGQMSIVGPRPHIDKEVEMYEEWHRLRLNIKPGITGLWQVNGRSDIPFDEMVKYDLYYIESWSLWLDIKTILRTVAAVLRGKGAY